MERVIIIGTGQQSNVVRYNIEEQNKYTPIGYFDIEEKNWGENIDEIEIIPGYTDFNKEYLTEIKKKYEVNKFVIALGNMKLRKELYYFFIENTWEAVNIIHPNSVISKKSNLGKGLLVEAGCLITPNPIIGDNVVINTGSQVNHDNIIEDHVYIASGVLLSGGVKIGENTLIDDSVTVTLGRKIGKNCIIGAGSVVTKDIPDNVIAYGNPCKIVRENK